MLIECLIRREGTTTVVREKMVYRFEPIFEFDGGGNVILGPTTSLCDVQNEADVEYLLSKGQFIPYVARPRIRKTVEADEFKEAPMKGYAFEKHLDGTVNAGYIVHDTVRAQFGGSNGWGERKDRVPFSSQLEAFQWLKDEVVAEVPQSAPKIADGVKTFKCKQEGCGAEFVASLELARHVKIHAAPAP